MSITGADVRRSFLEFFASKGHAVCASAPLIPERDPTLMFTNAGMVPFKDVFTGKDSRPFTRATSSQKCIRISGKHNDLENVGVTARHHTFFEMLGNFSFGDYFKEDAIAYAWELITKVWQMPQDRLVITVFGGEDGMPADTEAREIWRKVTGFGDERIIDMGMKDNFWSMGDTGPCGPCTEIHFFHGPNVTLDTFNHEPGADGLGWTEIWNLVFMQFDRDASGTLTPLPKPCVDTGAGLERVTSVLQGVTSNYDTDLLAALVQRASDISGKPYGRSLANDDVSMRVIADHARTAAFLIAEGVFPDRAGREYVLRRVMRRAIRHGHRLGIQKPFLHQIAGEVIAQMGTQYPELVERRSVIASVIEQEEVRFGETLERGLKNFEEEASRLKSAGEDTLPGKVAFKLYDTFGFPYDLTVVVAAEHELKVDHEGYEQAMAVARGGSEGSKVGDAALEQVWRTIGSDFEAKQKTTRFVGYDREEGEGVVLALVKGGAVVEEAHVGDEVSVLCDPTPFYAESGGQTGDQGTITTKSGTRVRITDTIKPLAGLVVHVGKVEEGGLRVGQTVDLQVDGALRTATRRNHSATHLLHYALRTVLGEQATQKGSLVGPSRLRFDFSHSRAVTPEELARIEDLVNEKVLTASPVTTEMMPIGKAKERGAIAMFGEKYADVVRVLTMTKDSVELCGGTHARNLGEIGLFKIVSEGGVAAGVRRIEAATGLNALALVRDLESTIDRTAAAVRAQPQELTEKVEKLVAREKQLEKELAEARRKIALGGTGGGGGGVGDLLGRAKDTAFGKVLSARVDASDAATLRDIADQLRDKLAPAIVLLGAAQGDKAALVLTVSKALTQQFRAGDLIKSVAAIIGGAGGGRPDMAQAGGPNIDRLDEALASLDAAIGLS